MPKFGDKEWNSSAPTEDGTVGATCFTPLCMPITEPAEVHFHNNTHSPVEERHHVVAVAVSEPPGFNLIKIQPAHSWSTEAALAPASGAARDGSGWSSRTATIHLEDAPRELPFIVWRLNCGGEDFLWTSVWSPGALLTTASVPESAEEGLHDWWGSEGKANKPTAIVFFFFLYLLRVDMTSVLQMVAFPWLHRWGSVGQ